MPVIEVDHLQKRYGEKVAVEDVSFTVEQGEIFGVLGPNGAGKTTTVECVQGLRRADGGTIRVLGLDPIRDRTEVRQRVGAQLQESQLPDKVRVWEALDLYRSFYRNRADIDELLADLGLAEQRNTYFQKLSGGQKQRLSVALALVGMPEVAILDELTTGLDPQGRRDTWDLVERIRDRGVTVVLVTHFMEEAQRLCDRLAIIDQGRVVAIDSPAGLLTRVGTEHRVHFRPAEPVEDALLLGLPDVTGVSRAGEEVTVTGTKDVLQSVLSALNGSGISYTALRVEQPSLDDAFVALTGRSGRTAPQSPAAGRSS
ncbi:ABC transporter ATP-binding protein [Micromonospora peucetia]|uniref:ABC transporter ATP-binding protein n=1 Tax=Micromonospora peucetia TaxID=47871 RepID=A0A1C6W3X1_9ACTN|nr:ABC transporter ATP-binding protein [Micromonospora peucetia]MCX4390267.1 ABC transporter ATP-binding protein [Micromonospora peucetia]WSA32426.1 ABC transporter ATP-binding protein [Micromonospora peucetia]SCL73289.1 ABC-2 type transport system ATP-binding protein [Micromonospora peucetia]